MMPSKRYLVFAVLAAAACHPVNEPTRASKSGKPTATDAVVHQLVKVALARLPIHFVPNEGQFDEPVAFVGYGTRMTVFLMKDATLVVAGASDTRSETSGSPARLVLRQSPTNATERPRAEGVGRLPGKANYLTGKSPERWRTDVPQFARVAFRDVYPGIDLVYYGNAETLEYDWIVAPGADPGRIALSIAGANQTILDDRGAVQLRTESGALRLTRPTVYQAVDGVRRSVRGDFVLDSDHHVRVALGRYDAGLPLTIDPSIHYSSYIGGTGLDVGADVALDSNGNVFVTGETVSTDFPLQNPADNPVQNKDVFVAKFNPTLTALVYSTYLGGRGEDRGFGIAVDPSGNAYVTGLTKSPDFPVTAGVIDTTCGSDGNCNPGTTTTGSTFQRSDAFVTKLDPTGHLGYSTYLGEAETDVGRGIAVDGLGTAYVVGSTQSRNFPTTPGVFQKQCAGGNPLASFCPDDIFVVRLNGVASDLVYSTFIGGTSRDDGNAISLDVNTGIASAAYITGFTQSMRDFPTTPGAFRTSPGPPAAQAVSGGGNGEAYVLKLNALGSKLVYSSYLGGSDTDDARSIAVDKDGCAYVLGQTASSDFPTLGAVDATCGTDGNCNATGTVRFFDAFVTKFNPQGSGLVFSTYLGGSKMEFVGGIAVDSTFHAYVTGETTSADFPVLDAVQSTLSDNGEAFVAKFTPVAESLAYSTFLGGPGTDLGNGIVVDKNANAYIAGLAGPSFPTTPGAFQATVAEGIGSGSAFVTRIGEGTVPPLPFTFPWLWVVVALLLLSSGTVLWRRRRTRR